MIDTGVASLTRRGGRSRPSVETSVKKRANAPWCARLPRAGACMLALFVLPCILMLVLTFRQKPPVLMEHEGIDDGPHYVEEVDDAAGDVGEDEVDGTVGPSNTAKPVKKTMKCARGKPCPTVLSVTPNHGPASGGTLVTVKGLNFGNEPSNVKIVRIGGRPCINFSYVSSTTATCVTPPGMTTNCRVEVLVGQHMAVSESSEGLFSYDAPVILGLTPNHAPRDGGTVIVIHGNNFGSSESFPMATIGGVPCVATQWVSDTTVHCVVPKGHGARLPVHVTVCGCGTIEIETQSTLTSPQKYFFSYDEDTVRDAAASIMHGIEFKPKPPTTSGRGGHGSNNNNNNAGMLTAPSVVLQNHRKQLVPGREYEISFVNTVTKEESFFAVPPELVGVLPLDDFMTRFGTCAIVGGSGSLTYGGFGPAIDAHDAVFRFNNAPTSRFEKDTGSKTTFQVLNPFWMETLFNAEGGPQEAGWWDEEATLVLFSAASQELFVQMRQLYPTSRIMYLSRALVGSASSAAARLRTRIQDVMRTPFPALAELTPVFYAVAFAAQVCSQVDVYGADTRRGKFHYFDEYDPGDEEREQAALEYLMLLAMQATGVIHSVNDHVAQGDAERGAIAAMDASVTGDAGEGGVEGPPGEGGTQCPHRPCVVDCSGNGVYYAGMCHCDPIYDGGDCSVNRMLLGADKLLEGIDNLVYNGSITMNKRDVNGTVIMLPEGITRQKLKEGDVYRVDRTLYHALPDEPALPRYRTCAIVGNSGALLLKEYGREIDAHDMVYRFNQAPTKGYELHVGARSSHESLNGYWVKQLLDEHRGFRWNSRQRDTAIVLFEMFEPWAFVWKSKAQLAEKDRWWKSAYVRLRRNHPDRKIISMSPVFVSWAYQLYRDLRRRFQKLKLGRYPGEKPMSGFYAFLFALQICDEIDLYGFQAWRETDSHGPLVVKYHYFDSAMPRPGSHSFDLARYIYQLMAMKFDNIRIID
eukprot:jgi/Mesvir1/23409/Mv21101-RA.1